MEDNKPEFLELGMVDTDSDFPLEEPVETQSENGQLNILEIKLPQDEIPEFDIHPTKNLLREITGNFCPVQGCLLFRHRFKKHRQFEEHWNRCHLEKSLKIICNICRWQVFRRDQMKRHLLVDHNITDVEGNSYLWWCLCPPDRYIDPKGYYLTTPQQRQRQQQHRHGDVRRTYPKKCPAKHPVVSRSTTPASACSTTSRPSSVHSSSSDFCTPPTTPPIIKIPKDSQCPRLSESNICAILSMAQERRRQPSPTDAGHGECSSCTVGATATALPMKQQPEENRSASTVGAATSEDNTWLQSLFMYPVRPSECLSQMAQGQCNYPDWYQQACHAYKDVVLGESMNTHSAQQALQHWPQTNSESLWPAAGDTGAMSISSMEQLRIFTREWHLAVGGLHYLDHRLMRTTLSMYATIQELQNQLATSEENNAKLKAILMSRNSSREEDHHHQ